MNKKNIIWFVVDGVRSYRSGIDDRDKIDIMDELALESVEFNNAFTSTPSSVLSASTMFTGLPSVYISRHYNDFEFDDTEIDSIVNMLEKNDYSIYSIFDAKALRCGLQNMAHSLPAKYRPKTSDHDKWWHNAEITKNVDHLFKKKHVKKPSFFLMWYNCRKDPKTTDHVKDAINIFKENDMWDDSIVIMNSDHGYPDPSTGLTVETMKKFSHDMIVTDDNSRIPLIIKYPGCPKGKKVDNLVRTSDIFHTLIELLDFDDINSSKMNYSNPNNGRSLINLIDGQDNKPRIARIDTRLGLSSNRTTALRSDTYKYVYHVDDDKEEFYYIVSDPYEMNNIISSEDESVKNELESFRKLYKKQDKDVFNYHKQKLKHNLIHEIEKFYRGDKKKNIKNLLLTCTPMTPSIVLELLIKQLNIIFFNINIDLVIPAKIDKKYKDLSLREIISVDSINEKEFSNSSIIEKEYDFVLYLTEGSRYNYIDPVVIKAIKGINSKRTFMMDYNFKMYSRMLSKWIYPFKRFFTRNLKYYKGETFSYIVKDLYIGVKDGIKVNIRNQRHQSFDTERIKQMRDENMSNSENPVLAINDDREKDRKIRLKSS
jgi:hypothetical protein